MNSEAPPVTIFINYRKAEAIAWARLLYDRLATEFGPDNVFLDQVSLEPGMKWLRQIRSRGSGCTAFLALIGPRWATELTQRAERGEEDYVRSEIETALEDSRVREVIPVLLEDAALPSKSDLRYVGSVKPLLGHQQADLRSAHLDADLRVLVEDLRKAGEQEEEPPPPPEKPPSPPRMPSSKRGHHDELVQLMLQEEPPLVPFLGPGANSCDRTEPWRDTDSTYLPDAEELAAYLAETLGMKPTPANLALVSQNLSIANGSGDLFRILRLALPPHQPPTSVHRFLAGLPKKLEGLGAPDRYQLIVTTNYDNALEQAFDEAGEPYDLAVYIAHGDDKGRFVHVPCDGESQLVVNPNGYLGFPINSYGKVERTTIMKIHGAVDRPSLWERNYVITEDDYIDYMSDGDIRSIVPQQLLAKLRGYSRLLFLGHEMNDWSLRVFLIRIFGIVGDRRLPNPSWAVHRDPSRFDERFWQGIGVDLAATSLDGYVRELDEHLTRAAATDRAQG